MRANWNTPICSGNKGATMIKYGGYLLAVILVVWGVIGSVSISTWLKERKYLS